MSFTENIADAVRDRLQAVRGASENPLVWKVAVKRSSDFDGGTADAHGNDGGALDPYTLFTVTGDVLIGGIWGVCNTSLTGATATIEVGVVGNTAALLAQETATEIVDGNIYVSATQAVGVAPLAGSGALFAINDGLDIIETIGTSDVTAGQIDYYVIYANVEIGASVVPA